MISCVRSIIRKKIGIQEVSRNVKMKETKNKTTQEHDTDASAQKTKADMIILTYIHKKIMKI